MIRHSQRKAAQMRSKKILIACSGVIVGVIAALALSLGSVISSAASPINLATAGNYSVLAGTTVTNVPTSTMNAGLGLSPGSSVTGAPVSPFQDIDNPAAVQAKTDLTTAYNAAAAAPSTGSIADAGDIGGESLTPGVYTSASSIFITGTLTLNAGGDPNAVFIFQAGSTVITASNASVVLVNGAQACNVYWQVGSSATLGTGTSFVGNVLALTSIGDDGGSTVNGRLLARNAAVTLNMTTINTQPCSSSTTSTSTTTGTITTTTGPSPPPTTTTINETITGPCGCTPKPKPPVTLKPITTVPGKTVTVTLPPPGCGCIVVPGATPPPNVKYVITHIDRKHCKATINQKTGKLKVKISKPGKYTIGVKHGPQKVTLHVTCKPKKKA